MFCNINDYHVLEDEVEETYLLVAFDDGEVCSVPLTKVLQPPKVELDQQYTVKWHTGKKYAGRVLFIGECKYMFSVEAL